MLHLSAVQRLVLLFVLSLPLAVPALADSTDQVPSDESSEPLNVTTGHIEESTGEVRANVGLTVDEDLGWQAGFKAQKKFHVAYYEKTGDAGSEIVGSLLEVGAEGKASLAGVNPTQQGGHLDAASIQTGKVSPLFWRATVKDPEQQETIKKAKALLEQLIANRDAPASKADYEAIRSRLAALFASGCWNAPNCTEAEYQEYQHLSAKKQSYDQAFEKSAQDVAKQETALKWLEDQAKRHPGPYATAEVTVVNLSYLGTYDSNTGTIHSGLKAAPIDASGHVAFKLNDLPMDVCAAASAGFLVGQNQVSHVDQGVLSGFVEGKACAGVELDLGDQKVGEIRDTVSARTFWDTGRDHDEYTAVDFDNKVELGDLMDSGFGIYGTVGLTSRTGVDPQYGVGIQAAF